MGALTLGALVTVEAGVGVVAPALVPRATAADAGAPFTAAYTGQLQIWTVPAGVDHVSVTLTGGAGGNGGMTRYDGVAAAQNGGRGGPGGVVTAVIPVTPGQDLTYWVGGGRA